MSRRGHIPQRQCVGCGDRRPSPELERFVAEACPSGHRLVHDVGRRLPGRGIYVCPGPDCFQRADETRGFARAARLRSLTIDPTLAPVANNSEDRT